MFSFRDLFRSAPKPQTPEVPRKKEPSALVSQFAAELASEVYRAQDSAEKVSAQARIIAALRKSGDWDLLPIKKEMRRPERLNIELVHAKLRESQKPTEDEIREFTELFIQSIRDGLIDCRLDVTSPRHDMYLPKEYKGRSRDFRSYMQQIGYTLLTDDGETVVLPESLYEGTTQKKFRLRNVSGKRRKMLFAGTSSAATLIASRDFVVNDEDAYKYTTGSWLFSKNVGATSEWVKIDSNGVLYRSEQTDVQKAITLFVRDSEGRGGHDYRSGHLTFGVVFDNASLMNRNLNDQDADIDSTFYGDMLRMLYHHPKWFGEMLLQAVPEIASADPLYSKMIVEDPLHIVMPELLGSSEKFHARMPRRGNTASAIIPGTGRK